MLASGNGEQVKQAQSRLKALGFYTGNVDGSLGKNPEASQTVAALQRYQAVAAQKAQETQNNLHGQELENEKLRLQQSGQQTDANAQATNAATAETERLTKAREERNRQAGTVEGTAAQIGATTLAPMAGTAIGMGMGKLTNMGLDLGQESRNKVLRGVAADRVSGLTTGIGAREAATRAGAMPSTNSVARVGGRMLPHIGLGAISIGKGLQILSEEDPDGPFYPEMANRAAGLGYIGVGAGLAKQGLRQAAGGGVAPDAQALAIINSNQLRRNNTPEPEAPTGPRPGTVPALRAEAKAAGIPKAYAMNKGALTQALESLNQGAKKLPGLAVPLAVGSLAYAATPDRAEAADGSGGGNQAEALTNAGVVTGLGLGAGQLMRAVPPMVGKAAGGALSMLSPGMMAGVMDDEHQFGPEENARAQGAQNQTLNTLARNLPDAVTSRIPGLSNAAAMAQVPERAPAGGDGFANARALQIPAGIPLPRRDGSSPYGEAQASAPMDFNRALADFQSLMAQQGQQ